MQVASYVSNSSHQSYNTPRHNQGGSEGEESLLIERKESEIGWLLSSKKVLWAK